MTAKLILEFLNDSNDFALGFECGRVYQDMKSQVIEIKGFYRFSNLEQLKLMAQKMGYSIQEIGSLNCDEVPNDYISITFVAPILN